MSRRRITISIRSNTSNSVPAERVAQIHIAGHSKYRKYILDTHDHPVIDPVWKLYERAIERIGHDRDLAGVGRQHSVVRRGACRGVESESIPCQRRRWRRPYEAAEPASRMASRGDDAP